MFRNNLMYKELDGNRLKITYKNKSLIFRFSQKRSRTVLLEILKRHPNEMNIHDIDDILSDSNRGLSDLINQDAFAHFLNKSKEFNRTIKVGLNIDKLFEAFKHVDSSKEITLFSNTRKQPSKEITRKLLEQSKRKCNITGIQLFHSLPMIRFLKKFRTISYDHRIPLAKGGDDNPCKIDNWQILSAAVNSEKNIICVACENPNCNKCALAFPEKYKAIWPTKEPISSLKKT